MPEVLQAGELVSFRSEDRGGSVGVVSRPIVDDAPGHVLTLRDGHVIGITASAEDVDIADQSSEGFAQLAYQLIKLGSHVIEQQLIAYRT